MFSTNVEPQQIYKLTFATSKVAKWIIVLKAESYSGVRVIEHVLLTLVECWIHYSFQLLGGSR